MASMSETLVRPVESAWSDDPAAMGPEERWLSLAAGTCLAGYGLSRIRLRALAALGIGGYLAYRGATGRCPLREKMVGRSHAQGLAGDWPPRDQDFERARSQSGSSGSSEPAPIEERSLRQVDCVDEAAIESFPASDPPSYTGTTSPPAVPIQ